jgi:uncharacterized membrane protein
MIFDWTINASHVITAIGLVGGAFGIVYAIRSDVRILKAELDAVKIQITKITDVLLLTARQEERLNAHERRISRLEDVD